MADDGKPEHYAVKLQRRIDDLEAENATLRQSTGVVVGAKSEMPEAAMFAAFFTAAHEAGGGSRENLADLLMDRWHRVRTFLSRVREGEDMALYNALMAKEKAAAEAKELQDRLDKEGEERKQKARRDAMNARAS